MHTKLKTFTGDTIYFDADTHAYTTLDGNRLESASAYADRHLPSFDSDRIAGFVAKKHDAKKEDILEMWERNGDVSKHFGTALHLAMEQWFRFPHGLGTEKRYNLPKSQYLRDAVTTFPLKDELVLPEVVVSDMQMRRAGRLDGIRIVDVEPGLCEILDFKSDADVDKNLDHHVLQLNFYREIIEAKGKWRVRGMVVWGFNGWWTPYQLPRKDLED